MPEPDPAVLRSARAQLLSAADSFSAGSAETQVRLTKALQGWVGESKKAFDELAAHWVEQDRLILASVRDIAHHITPATNVDGDTDESAQ